MAAAGRVVVVGSVNLDLVVQVAALPHAGQTVTGATTTEGWGGKGANAACAAARLGAATVLVAAVGDDDVGRAAAADLVAAGVDPRLDVRVGTASGRAVVLVAADGENSVIVAPGANAELAPGAVAGAGITSADVVVLSAEAPLAALEAGAQAAQAAGARLLLNASPVVDVAVALAAWHPVVVVNEHEAAALGGAGQPAEAGRRIAERTGAPAIVTLGRRGALVVEGTAVLDVPSVAVSARDTTGAGDTFLGALAAELAGGAPLAAAARVACAAAAYAVTGLGARWQPTRADVAALSAR